MNNFFQHNLFQILRHLTNKIRSIFWFQDPINSGSCKSFIYIMFYDLNIWHIFLLRSPKTLSVNPYFHHLWPCSCRRPIPDARRPAQGAQLLARWEQAGLYTQLRAGAKGARIHSCNDGPLAQRQHPYRTCAQQDPQGRGDAQPADARLPPITCRAGLATAFADRMEDREDALTVQEQAGSRIFQSAALVEFRQDVPCLRGRSGSRCRRAEFKRLGRYGLIPTSTIDFRRRGADRARAEWSRATALCIAQPSRDVERGGEDRAGRSGVRVRGLHQRYGGWSFKRYCGRAIAWEVRVPWRGAEDKVSFYSPRVSSSGQPLLGRVPATAISRQKFHTACMKLQKLREMGHNGRKIYPGPINLTEMSLRFARVEEWFAPRGTRGGNMKLYLQATTLIFLIGCHVPLLAGRSRNDDAGTGLCTRLRDTVVRYVALKRTWQQLSTLCRRS